MFATMFYLCTQLSCQEYIVDSSDSLSDCYINMEAHSNSTALYWTNDKKANSKGFKWWLNVIGIDLSKAELESIVDYDYKCKEKK